MTLDTVKGFLQIAKNRNLKFKFKLFFKIKD